MNGGMERWMDERWKDGWIRDRGMVRWMEGRMDGWMDG